MAILAFISQSQQHKRRSFRCEVLGRACVLAIDCCCRLPLAPGCWAGSSKTFSFEAHAPKFIVSTDAAAPPPAQTHPEPPRCRPATSAPMRSTPPRSARTSLAAPLKLSCRCARTCKKKVNVFSPTGFLAVGQSEVQGLGVNEGLGPRVWALRCCCVGAGGWSRGDGLVYCALGSRINALTLGANTRLHTQEAARLLGSAQACRAHGKVCAGDRPPKHNTLSGGLRAENTRAQ